MNDEGGVGGFLGPHEYNATSASGKRISGSNSDFFFFWSLSCVSSEERLREDRLLQFLFSGFISCLVSRPQQRQCRSRGFSSATRGLLSC